MGSPTPLRPTAAAGASSYSLHRRRARLVAGLRRPRVRRCKMKLMYFLMDRDEQRNKRLELEFEVRLHSAEHARAPLMVDRCPVGRG